jgi:hypothetical protein
MRHAVVAVLVVLVAPAHAGAWGFAAHREITARAIAELPPEIRPFFEAYRAELVSRSIDPDLWRTAGWEDDPNHFVDFGLPELGAYPFAALPREHGAALEKFGAQQLRRIGLLPWREEEEFGNLRRAFASYARSPAANAITLVLFAAVAAHYLQDAYQPLHATDNYDGQLTGQLGVHARFETALVERYQSRLRIAPPPMPPIVDPRDAAFDALLASHQLVAPLLAGDREAAAGMRRYDDAYFDRFFAAVGPMLQAQLGRAVAATAALIAGAWEQAGRPPVPVVQSSR